MTHTGGGAKYVFAGTREHERDAGVKVCPRCGQILFEDMDTCFDCLYSFKKDAHGSRGHPEPSRPDAADERTVPGVEPPASVPSGATDLLADIELDEIDEVDEDMPESKGENPMANARHRKREPDQQDDTLDFSELELTTVAAPQAAQLRVVIRTKDMQVHIPIPQPGLSIGRGEDNDIVLRSRLVSRRHLFLLPQEDGVTAQDCGATNPTLVHGHPLEGSERVSAGDLIEVCGVTLELEEEPADTAA